MKSILDPSFRYTKSVDTDLRKTFAKIRREQRNQQRAGVNDENLRNIIAMPVRKHVSAS